MSESFYSAEVSTFSSPLTASPHRANAWLLKSSAGIKNKKNPSPMTQRLWQGWSDQGSAQRLHAKSTGYICSDRYGGVWWHIESQQVGVRALTECLQTPKSIWGETFLQTGHCIQFVIPRVWTVWGNTHLAWGVRADCRVCISRENCSMLILE